MAVVSVTATTNDRGTVVVAADAVKISDNRAIVV